MKKIISEIGAFLADRFNLDSEQDDHSETIKSIERGVEFKGINLWTLVFAIFIASIGLNVNSTAVIIGAMLISPLMGPIMGPIMGLGLSVGVYDFGLLKKSLKNLSIAVAISVLTSSLYFLVSPLDEAQSELLARTTPTIYDVLIALFGGMAGILAGATREKGNPVPGVAIATALMPPLCTAGFGIATGNVYYFMGAFYLFFINAVMISLSTFLMVRFLKFPPKQAVDKLQAYNVKKYIYIIVVITVLPSIYFAYRIIQQTIFRTKAIEFVNKEMNFEKTQIIGRDYFFGRPEGNVIKVVLAGETIDSAQIKLLENKLLDYSLTKAVLDVKQGAEDVAQVNIDQIKSGIIEDLYRKNELAMQNKDEKIKLLEKELLIYKNEVPLMAISEEARAINPKLTKFSAFNSIIRDMENQTNDTTLIVYLASKPKMGKEETDILKNWLNKRLGASKIKLLSE